MSSSPPPLPSHPNKGAENYAGRLAAALNQITWPLWEEAIAMIQHVWLSNQQIITCGNGGSALTALHVITDWNKSLSPLHPFRGRSLVDNIGLVTAWANDSDYSQIFSRQLESLGQPGDLLILFSGSGRSSNVLRAVGTAHRLGCSTLALCGFDGGLLKEKAQKVLHVPIHDMQICEDIHMMFGHMVLQSLQPMTKGGA